MSAHYPVDMPPLEKQATEILRLRQVVGTLMAATNDLLVHGANLAGKRRTTDDIRHWSQTARLAREAMAAIEKGLAP